MADPLGSPMLEVTCASTAANRHILDEIVDFQQDRGDIVRPFCINNKMGYLYELRHYGDLPQATKAAKKLSVIQFHWNQIHVELKFERTEMEVSKRPRGRPPKNK